MTPFLRDVLGDPFLWALGLLMLAVWLFGRREGRDGEEPPRAEPGADATDAAGG